ncbi:MAG: 2,3-bisphosphoglycerate-independent phosphoglycerate mutase [Candidatus Aureabacteria bacterium]|nr:2,3-bisphosphoglycerate-independent phosphoglycerate mutase [Candidatus Auribacterota bacterium]
MVPESVMKSLSVSTPSRIVLLVMDGLGDVRQKGKTPLEAARTPHLDLLAAEATLGLSDPISSGITPGSGPAHISLFGYDPIRYQIGRGVLEATGIDLKLKPDDVASRGNFAAMDDGGLITDRRAGRISTEENAKLVDLMGSAIREIQGIEVILRTVKEHRFVAVFRGPGLDDRVSETDPQVLGKKGLDPAPLAPEARKTASVVKEFIARADSVLRGRHPANTLLLRGFSAPPTVPQMQELFKLTPAAIATYPMYRGLARLVGMTILPTGETVEEEFDTLRKNWERFDFFFIHVKKTDSYGEDWNFPGKVKVIEEVDRCLPRILDLKPDVLAVTGDHSTPCCLSAHSWHPNPFLLRSPYVRADETAAFSEATCVRGGLGRFPAVEAMALMLANALKLEKFGA